mmetsp:Transcript_1627/g.2340  ORF Transcript_1627/g.2340 Transcript_1627/m.2340 type:complete len:112 (-) Transcript_1627:260-595(-)
MMVGNLGGRGGELKRLDKIFYKAIRIQGLVVGHKQGFEDMLKTMERHQIKPVVGKVFDLAHSENAFSYMATDKHRFGKIVIRVSTSKSSRQRSPRSSSSSSTARDVTFSKL